MSLQELNDKIETIGKSITAAQEIAKDVYDVKELSGQNQQAINKYAEDASNAMQKIQELEQAQKGEVEARKFLEKKLLRSGDVGGVDKEFQQKARNEYNAYLKKGHAIDSGVYEEICKDMANISLVGATKNEKAAQIDLLTKDLVAGSNPDGGYFIRPERVAEMIKRNFETSPVRSVANIRNTVSDSVEIIIDDNEAASGGWVGEVDSRSTTNTPKVGLLTIPVHEQFAQPRATQKMLDDAGFDVEAWLQGKIEDKLMRTENTAFVSGDGSQKPRGFLSLSAWASAGTYERNKLEQINSGSAGAFTADGIKGLQNSLKEIYQPSAVFMIKRASWEKIITLKDGQGAYLLNTNSLKEGDTKVLLGKRVIFADDMPAVANDALALAYGDFGVGYTIVDRFGIRVIRDIYTAKPYILFYTIKRVGGDVTNYESIKIQKLAV